MISQQFSNHHGIITSAITTTLFVASLFGGQPLSAQQRPTSPVPQTSSAYGGTSLTDVTVDGHAYKVLSNANMQSVQDVATNQMVGVKMRGNWMKSPNSNPQLAQHVLDVAAQQAAANPAATTTVTVPVAATPVVARSVAPIAAASISPDVTFDDASGIVTVQDAKLGPVTIDTQKLDISYITPATSMTPAKKVTFHYNGPRENESSTASAVKHNTGTLAIKVLTGDRQGHFGGAKQWQIKQGDKVIISTGQETHDYTSHLDQADKKQGYWKVIAASINDDIAATEDAATKLGKQFKMDSNAKNSLAAFVQP